MSMSLHYPVNVVKLSYITTVTGVRAVTAVTTNNS